MLLIRLDYQCLKLYTESMQKSESSIQTRRKVARFLRDTSPSLAQNVYESLKDSIVDFSLPPGTVLTESSLASKFNVSRTPVREALQLLSTEGLVEITPTKGARVAECSLEEVLEAYTVRELLEPYACRLAAERMSEDLLFKLEEVSKNFPGKVRTHQQAVTFEMLNRRFHTILLDASGNSAISDIVKRMMWSTQQAAFYVSSNRYCESNHEHNLILKYLRSEDGEGAAKAMRRHLAQAKHRLVR